MRDAARLFLDSRMSRRSFVSRLTAAGVAAGAASGLSTSLEADQTSRLPGATPGRVLNDATGGDDSTWFDFFSIARGISRQT